MYDKRSAWALGGIAPQRGDATRLSHIVAAAMTEIPTSKQWRADSLSATIDGPLVCESLDVLTGTPHSLQLAPSAAISFAHGFSSLVKFFPEGRTLTSQIEERLWDELIGLNSSTSPTVFDDQYISTGGQFYELIVGHDRWYTFLSRRFRARATDCLLGRGHQARMEAADQPAAVGLSPDLRLSLIHI